MSASAGTLGITVSWSLFGTGSRRTGPAPREGGNRALWMNGFPTQDMRNFVSRSGIILGIGAGASYEHNPSYHSRAAAYRGASDLALQLGLGVLSVRGTWLGANHFAGTGIIRQNVGMAPFLFRRPNAGHAGTLALRAHRRKSVRFLAVGFP